MDDDRTPTDLRQRVHAGIVASLRGDYDRRGKRTAHLLILSGFVGIAGALGATLLVADHDFGHHARWHVAAFSTVWAGLLVVALALALLQVRTPSLPLARSASVGLIGLGIAGLCGAACPDSHFLSWWVATSIGGRLTEAVGLPASALCFGFTSALAFGAAASALVRPGDRRPAGALLPAFMLLLLLAPGVALQSVGSPWSVWVGWLLGTAAGSYAGVEASALVRRAVPPSL